MNIAQTLVQLSLDPRLEYTANWHVVAVGLGGERQPGGVYRFTDGSGVILTEHGALPVEYIGG